MAAPNSPWDNPQVKPKSARYAKFKDIDDTYAGVVTGIKVAVFDAGKETEKSCPVLVLDTDQEVTCSASNLHREVWKLRPEVGDFISIRYTGDDEDDYNRKVFAIDLVRAADIPATPRDQDEPAPEDPYDEEPPPEDVWSTSEPEGESRAQG